MRQRGAPSTMPGRFIAALRDAAPRLTCLVGNAGVDLPDAVCRSPARVLSSLERAMVDRFLEEFPAELDADHHSAKDPSS
jgi:hypothetical protein